MVWNAGIWLQHHFSLFGADGETDVITGCGEPVHFQLHLLFTSGVEGAMSVVRKEKVPYYSTSPLHLCDDLQTSQVEQLPVRPLSDHDASVAISGSICQHSREHQAEQCRGKDTTLLDTIGDWEGF